MSAETTHRTVLEVMERRECLALLADRHLGRLAVSIANQPVIFPVTYALDGDTIVFRTDPGTKLYGARGRLVAFEIDGIDGELADDLGWSVLVVGTADVVESESELARLDAIDLGPWNPGPKQYWLRIHGGAITGRRLTRPEPLATT
ncbi:MAG: pyridoxamine 5'-phosphate oxidase family protein [Actinomycetota bacterium]|nr:pyridoxamine 5'-phosphate oxidase family protein [Actinomycetota bacterium]